MYDYTNYIKKYTVDNSHIILLLTLHRQKNRVLTINNNNMKVTRIFYKDEVKILTILCMIWSMTMCFTACSDDINSVNESEAAQNDLPLNAEVDAFNINDGEFTAENWRQSEAIYLYDDEGKQKDQFGRDGYTLVNLPWLKGDVQTNLPEGFCDDMTRENGWELVLNRCGCRSIKNNNFLAVYNKYTGILRFFFYMPEKFQTGNDHVWEVIMTDNMATNMELRYGRPQNCEKMNKSEIGLIGDKTTSEYIAPWVASLSSDGLITPNAGWWAFDVDLSTYSGKAISENDNIKLQMRSMNKSAISLNSQITANIDGSIKADIDLLQSQHLGNSVLGHVSKLVNIGASAQKIATSITEEKWGDAFGAGIGICKTVANMCGVKTESSQDIQGTLDGKISLAMNGSIASEGIIQNSTTTTGVPTPTMYLKDFDYTNTPGLGEGIWNLEKSPVVYYTNARVTWENRYYHNIFPTGNGEAAVYTTNKKSPFGGQYFNQDSGDSPYVKRSYSKEPFSGYICYFDPSTIKVQLNPKVFTPEEIANAKVYAVCGVRKGAAYGRTDKYRAAFGLTKSKVSISDPLHYVNPQQTAAPFDAMSSFKNVQEMKQGAKFDAESYDSRLHGVFGRGDDDYILEPQGLCGGDANVHDFNIPAYEVNVTLVVEHNGKTFVYTRTYLPEYEFIEAAKVPGIPYIDPFQEMPDNYVSEIYQQQRRHIANIRDFLRYTLQFDQSTLLSYMSYGIFMNYDKPNEAGAYLVDGDNNTKWCTSKKCLVNEYSYPYTASRMDLATGKKRVWAVEFHTNIAFCPSGYTMVTANDNGVFPERRPKAWTLYGWTVDGERVLLDEVKANAGGPNDLTKSSLKERDFFLTIIGLHKGFNRYRLEISECFDSDDDATMQLAEFRLR